MKTRLKTYDLPAKDTARILVATDTHFEFRRPHDLDPILAVAKQHRPDAILFAGDTINYLEDINTPSAQKALRQFFQKAAAIAPVYMGIGNHDQMEKERIYLPEKAPKLQKTYLDFIATIPEINLLHNKRIKLSNNINLIGLTLPRSCYQQANSKATYEDPSALAKVLSEKSNLLKRSSTKETNILIMHSPRRLTPAALSEMTGIDYVICGHMHQGCVPFGLDEVLPGTGGIVAPGYAPLPIRARHTYPNYSDKLIVLPAYKTFAGHRHFLNALFPRSLSILSLQR